MKICLEHKNIVRLQTHIVCNISTLRALEHTHAPKHTHTQKLTHKNSHTRTHTHTHTHVLYTKIRIIYTLHRFLPRAIEDRIH